MTGSLHIGSRVYTWDLTPGDRGVVISSSTVTVLTGSAVPPGSYNAVLIDSMYVGDVCAGT